MGASLTYQGAREVRPAPQDTQLAADGQKTAQAIDAAAHELWVCLVDTCGKQPRCEAKRFTGGNGWLAGG